MDGSYFLTMIDMVRSMMPISCWGDALLIATYILNRVLSKSVHQSTPYEMWTGRKPKLGGMRPWGSAVYVHNTYQHGKLGPRGKKCIFVRYSEHSKGYVDGTVYEIESRDVDLLEIDFPNKGNESKEMNFYEMEEDLGSPTRTIETEEAIPQAPVDSGSDMPSSSSLPLNEESPAPQMRRSQGVTLHVVSLRLRLMPLWLMSDAQEDEEPRSYRDALSSGTSDKWIIAMKEEMESMRTNQV